MKNEEMYLEIIDNIRDGVYFVDTNRQITFWNRAAEEITGYTAEEIVGKKCQDSRLHHIDTEGQSVCVLGCPLDATLDDGWRRKHEVFLRHKDGYRVPIKVSIFPIRDEGKIIGAIQIFTPNSPNVYEEELIDKLANSANKDRLTKLPNRRNTESYIEYRFSELKRFQRKFCIVFLDIDDFSNLNNTYGHELGDEVLKIVAKSIMRTIRRIDLFGRWGGEEFIGVFEIKNDEDAVLMAEKIRALIANSAVEYEGKSLTVKASLGVTVARVDDTVESVVKRADGLMYKSKQNGKNCVTSD